MRGIMPQTRLWWGKMSTGVVRRVAILSTPPARPIREFLQPREREVGPRDPPSHAWERAGYPTLRRFAGGEASDPAPRQAATVKAARAWEWEALSGPPCSFQRRLLPPSAQTKTTADGGGCQGRRSRRAERGGPLQTACRPAGGWGATGGVGGRREPRRGRLRAPLCCVATGWAERVRPCEVEERVSALSPPGAAAGRRGGRSRP